ncbi:MAG TPA: peptidase MA family metallohydrolase [Anaerolineales bacterium]|nr:peptidase MA family metallohydrolase [Anaerolineales bacterium]
MYRTILALILNFSLVFVTSAFTLPRLQITNDQVILDFPISATFRASFTSDSEIQSIILEYGNEQQNCGEVIAKAFPQFTPGRTVKAEWTWEMRQSGSLPPGATLWWRWRITDANGNETVSERKTATWLDDIHNWQSLNNGDFIRLHWYEGDQNFAIDLAKAANDGLQFNETNSGLKAESPIDIYIYADTNDLKDAILYEPSWAGGQAFPNQDIVILGISQSDLDWGRDAIVHELTHVLVGHLTFSCLGDVPTWLNEGLAVYSEGELERSSQRQLENAIREDTLLTVRSLSSGFSEVSDKAYLSYSQSYSLTKFLIETHGQEKMTLLLVSLRDGLAIDEALTQIYGFNIDGLEAAWRQDIGAAPSAPLEPASMRPTPTFVPTIVPLSIAPVVNQSTPTAIPTSTFDEPTETPVRTAPPLWLTLTLLGFCCVFLLLIGIVVLGFVVRRQNQAGGENAR